MSNEELLKKWDRKTYPNFIEWLDSKDFKELIIDYEWDLSCSE